MKLITGPNVISVIVTAGFFGVLYLLLARPISMPETAWTVVNILVGVLGSQFGNVVQFQIGSTATSKAKDDTIKDIATKGTGNG